MTAPDIEEGQAGGGFSITKSCSRGTTRGSSSLREVVKLTLEAVVHWGLTKESGAGRKPKKTRIMVSGMKLSRQNVNQTVMRGLGETS